MEGEGEGEGEGYSVPRRVMITLAQVTIPLAFLVGPNVGECEVVVAPSPHRSQPATPPRSHTARSLQRTCSFE